MRIEELLDLLKKNARVHGLEQEPVGAQLLPVLFVDGEGSQQRDGRMIWRGARGLDYFAACLVALHAHVGDDHVILLRAQEQFALTRGGGSIDLESTDLEDSFHREQNSYFIIDKQDAALHSDSLSKLQVDLAAC